MLEFPLGLSAAFLSLPFAAAFSLRAAALAAFSATLFAAACSGSAAAIAASTAAFAALPVPTFLRFGALPEQQAQADQWSLLRASGYL